MYLCSVPLAIVSCLCLVSLSRGSPLRLDDSSLLDQYVEVRDPDSVKIRSATEDLFEGDIVLDERQKVIINSPFRVRSRDFVRKWPKNTVVYKLADGDYNEREKNIIFDAMDTISQKTGCIRFREKSKRDKKFVLIYKGNKCSSSIGFLGTSKQKLSLGAGCIGKGTIMHELTHAIGFGHMHNDLRRDKNVKILWENVKTGKEHNFVKNPYMNNYDVPYDFKSIMHYDSYAFSVTKIHPTILKKANNNKIGYNHVLSKYDTIKIRRMYSC